MGGFTSKTRLDAMPVEITENRDVNREEAGRIETRAPGDDVLVLRDVHIQSPIVWIGISWIGAALFLAPAISGGEPREQGLSRRAIVLGNAADCRGPIAGDYLGVMGYAGEAWFWVGNQGLSYIQLGRARQIGFLPVS
jgi:nitric oxide reductase large subunit